MSIQPVAPLTIEPVGPLDPDWFEDDDTPNEDDHATTAQRHHLLSRYNNLEEAR